MSISAANADTLLKVWSQYQTVKRKNRALNVNLSHTELFQRQRFTLKGAAGTHRIIKTKRPRKKRPPARRKAIPRRAADALTRRRKNNRFIKSYIPLRARH